MKKIAIISLVLIMAIGLCACRMGRNDETTPTPTTEPATEPPATTMPEPTIPEPTVLDPTLDPIAPNVPDPNVDDNHLIDPTDGSGTTEDGQGLIGDIEKKLS